MKAFCINLKKRTDRWKEAKEEFTKHGLKVKRWDAIEGAQGRTPTNGANEADLGCTLSHLRLVEHLDKEGIDMALVLEDDVEFADGFNLDFLNDAPDGWDMIWLGGNHVEPLTPVSERFGRINKTYTTHAYIIRKSAYPVVIDELGKADRQVDVHMGDAHARLNCYAVTPSVAWQRKSYSDIQGQETFYEFMKPMHYLSVEGWFDFEDIYTEMIETHPDGAHFVEVGSWLGKSSCFMAESLRRKGRSIRFDCVDLWSMEGNDPFYQTVANGRDLWAEFQANIAKTGYTVEALRMRSNEAANRYKSKSLDFVFIDANHDYRHVIQDIRSWLPKVKSGGILAGHDYTPTHKGVTRAVRQAFGHNFTTQGTSWIHRVK